MRGTPTPANRMRVVHPASRASGDTWADWGRVDPKGTDVTSCDEIMDDGVGGRGCRHPSTPVGRQTGAVHLWCLSPRAPPLTHDTRKPLTGAASRYLRLRGVTRGKLIWAHLQAENGGSNPPGDTTNQSVNTKSNHGLQWNPLVRFPRGHHRACSALPSGPSVREHGWRHEVSTKAVTRLQFATRRAWFRCLWYHLHPRSFLNRTFRRSGVEWPTRTGKRCKTNWRG